MIKELYKSKFKLSISPSTPKVIKELRRTIELRDDNPDALNTALLGVHRAYFYPGDQNILWDHFGIDKNDFERESHQLKTIHKERNVSSDPFNLFCTWVIHSLKNSSLNTKVKFETMHDVAKLMHYKFFTSLVGKYFQFKVSPEIMQYTVDNLSKKYALKDRDTDTWAKLIDKHAEVLVDGSGIHEKTIKDYKDDEKILYMITDINTRLNSTIKAIAIEFYENVESNKKLGSYSMTGENASGEQTMKDISNTLDTSVVNLNALTLTTSKFINRNHVEMVSKLVKVRADVIRDMLISYTDLATKQHRNGEGLSEVIKHSDLKTTKSFLTYGDNIVSNTRGSDAIDVTFYSGYALFNRNVAMTCFNNAINSGVNINSKLGMLQNTINTFRNSRIVDQDVIDLKASARWHVEKLSKVNRNQTVVSLGLALVLYLLITVMDIHN